MDLITLCITVFIAIVGIAMLGKLLGHIVGAAAIIVAILNDLADIGVVTIVPKLSWMADLATFFLILLAYRNAGSLLSLADLVPGLGFLPFHTLALLVSWRIRERRKAVYVVRK